MLKKILFILHTPPPIHGSSIVGSYIRNSNLILSRFNTDFINLSTSDKISEIGKYNLKKVLRILDIFFQLIIKNIRNNYDLCYLAIAINGKAFYRDLLVVFILKMFNRKIILHLHNKGASNFKIIFRKIGYRYIFNNTKVILLSDLLYPDIKKYIDKKNVYICSNGITDIKPKKKKYNIKERADLLFLSNLIISKGLYIFLEACLLLKQKNKKFNAHFVGSWKEVNKTEIEKYLQENMLNDSVFFYGPKFNDEKKQFWEMADIFVFPTFYSQECFPLVLLEAMQFGLPIVSTFEGGIPDLINEGENGYLCKQKDSKCLAAKLELLIENNELRNQMGINGRRRFRRKLYFRTIRKKNVKYFTNCSK